MDKQQWGRRRSDGQAYPKTRGKEVLPSGLTPVPGTRRVIVEEMDEPYLEDEYLQEPELTREEKIQLLREEVARQNALAKKTEAEDVQPPLSRPSPLALDLKEDK